MRLVLDTCVIVLGLRSNLGASRPLLTGALERRFTVLVSVPLFLEYEAVLGRSGQRAELGWTISDVAVFLDALASVAEPVRMNFLWRPLLRDLADEMVLETAVNGSADLLVTHNVKHFAAIPLAFGVRVQAPRNALAQLRRNEKKTDGKD
jgi:putative PIN family toxin of toxin-antitoxin system